MNKDTVEHVRLGEFVTLIQSLQQKQQTGISRDRALQFLPESLREMAVNLHRLVEFDETFVYLIGGLRFYEDLTIALVHMIAIVRREGMTLGKAQDFFKVENRAERQTLSPALDMNRTLVSAHPGAQYEMYDPQIDHLSAKERGKMGGSTCLPDPTGNLTEAQRIKKEQLKREFED